MLIYFLIFLIGYLYYYFARGPKVKSDKLLFAFLFFLALFVGLGDMIGGYDRYIYGEGFDVIADDLREYGTVAGRFYLINGSEWGYFLWETLMAYITSNRYWFILATTLVTYALYYRAFKTYLTNYPFAMIVFLALLYYFTMTYLRQTLACGIVWQGVRYIWERRFWKFLAYVVIGYTFHSSALIFLPFYFMPIKKYKKTTIRKWLIYALLLGMTPIPNMLIAFAGTSTGQGGRTDAYMEQDQGFRIEYVIEAVFFMWLFFKNYWHIRKRPKDLVFLNMSIVFCVILLVFMRFGQGGRFGWYFMLGLIYTLTSITTRRFSYRWMTPLVIFVCFALFSRITYAWRNQNVPYKTFFTNGEPSGNGEIYSIYEYDDNYTRDKLYRK